MSGLRRTKKGIVTSDKMHKTVVVRVESRVEHPEFKKVIKRYKKFKAHDENNVCKIGDKVLIVESRPISKDKCWRVQQILEKGKTLEFTVKEDIDAVTKGEKP